MTDEDENDCCLDLYDDILVEDLANEQESAHEVWAKYQDALKRIASLEEITKQNETDLVSLRKKNVYLMKNISVLYKTACTELERKKEAIESLRKQLASGNGYEKDCRNRIPDYPYRNAFDSQNVEDHRFGEGSFVSHENFRWEARDPNLQFSDSHHFYSPNNAIRDTHNSTPDSQSPYSSSNIPNNDRSEKLSSQSKPHNSYTAHTTESAFADSYTPPTRNTDTHNKARDSSSHASHTRYTDEHTPHTKPTDSSTSHSKHSSSHTSNRKHSESKSSQSKRSTSSHSEKRSSSSKRPPHSDSRKHNTHRSDSRLLEPHSSQSKHSESKKSGRSSRTRSKDHEPSSSSSSRHKRSHSAERSDTKLARNSDSSDSKNQDSRSDKRKRKGSVESSSSKDGKSKTSSATAKRKLSEEFSESCEPKSKRRHKEKSAKKLPESSASQSSETDQNPKSNSGEEEANLCEENSKLKDPSLEETDSQVTLEITNKEKEDSNLHDLKYNGVHESPTIADQELTLETEQDTPVEMTGLPITDMPVDATPETITESQSLESVTKESEDTTATAQKSMSSTSGNNSSHESDTAVTVTEGDAEKVPDKCEELEIEIHEPCGSVLWAGKSLSDSDENSSGLEDGTASDADKIKSLSDVQSSHNTTKEEESDCGSDTSDNKSDTSPEKRSIVIKCFGGNHEDSRSPIIIPCYPSKKNKPCSSASESDEGCDSDNNTTGNQSRSLIARSLFPLNNRTSEKSSEVGEDHKVSEVEAKPIIFPSLNNSKNCNDKDGGLRKANSKRASAIKARKKKHGKLGLNNNLDFECFKILEKESDDLSPVPEEVDTKILQNGDTENNRKEDYHSNSRSDDNGNENQITVVEPPDKNNACSDDELEEGEVLTDEENESVAVDAKAASAPVRSPVRYRSLSPVECRKGSGKQYRENSRKRPSREPMRSDPHNRQRSLPDRSVSKTHGSSAIGKHSRHRGDKSSRNIVHSAGSGSRSQSRWVDDHHKQSGVHHKRGNRKKWTY